MIEMHTFLDCARESNSPLTQAATRFLVTAMPEIGDLPVKAQVSDAQHLMRLDFHRLLEVDRPGMASKALELCLLDLIRQIKDQSSGQGRRLEYCTPIQVSAGREIIVRWAVMISANTLTGGQM